MTFLEMFEPAVRAELEGLARRSMNGQLSDREAAARLDLLVPVLSDEEIWLAFTDLTEALALADQGAGRAGVDEALDALLREVPRS